MTKASLQQTTLDLKFLAHSRPWTLLPTEAWLKDFAGPNR
jgi:hypothetical protein